MSMPAKMWCRDECSSKILGFFEDLWLALVRKYKFPDEWVFFFGGSLSLFTTNCRKAGHTTYNKLLLFLLLLFLLAAFFSFWNMKKNYCGLTKWLQHMKIWHGKGYFKYSIQQQCSKAGKKWHLEMEVLSNFLGSSPPFLLLKGYNFIEHYQTIPYCTVFFRFLEHCALSVGKWKFFFIEMDPKEYLEIIKKFQK